MASWVKITLLTPLIAKAKGDDGFRSSGDKLLGDTFQFLQTQTMKSSGYSKNGNSAMIPIR